MNKGVFVVVLCVVVLLSSTPGFCESELVLVKKIEILSGPTTYENNVVYIQEDEEYLVRLKLVFPPLSGTTFKIRSHLHGFVSIIERNIRSRLGEASFESKFIAETLTIELEGIAPKALVDIKGSEVTATDDRKIKGEKAFSLFDIYADNVPMHLKYEEEMNIVLSSSEILQAKEKIKEVEEAIIKIESCNTSDLYITKSIILRMKTLLEIAKACLAEGAPVEALNLANECLELARISIIRDQIDAMNSLLIEIEEVDVAESSKFAHLALQEIDKIGEGDDLDTCLSHIEKSEEYYNKSTQSLISEINREVTKYEINPITFIMMIVAFTAIIFILGFLMIYQRGKRKVFDLGIEEGRRKAAEEEVTVEDIILGKKKKEGE